MARQENTTMYQWVLSVGIQFRAKLIIWPSRHSPAAPPAEEAQGAKVIT